MRIINSYLFLVAIGRSTFLIQWAMIVRQSKALPNLNVVCFMVRCWFWQRSDVLEVRLRIGLLLFLRRRLEERFPIMSFSMEYCSTLSSMRFVCWIDVWYMHTADSNSINPAKEITRAMHTDMVIWIYLSIFMAKIYFPCYLIVTFSLY